METYTISYTRRQVIVKTSDGKLRHFPRTEKGIDARERHIDRLVAAGYTEAVEEEHWFAVMCREIAAEKGVA